MSKQNKPTISGPSCAAAKISVASGPVESSETLLDPRRELLTTRIDRWLCAARFFKSRSQAQQACDAGHIAVNGVTVRPSRTIQIGDKISARAPRGLVVALVLQIEEKRQGSVRARQLYEDQSPPSDEDQATPGKRRRGAGRPTKADRRAIARLTRTNRDE